MMKATDVQAAVKEVSAAGGPPEVFCKYWPAFRAALNAIVKQVSNPLVSLAWSILKPLGNGLYKQCPK